MCVSILFVWKVSLYISNNCSEMRHTVRSLAILIDHCLTSNDVIWVDRDDSMRNSIVHAAAE